MKPGAPTHREVCRAVVGYLLDQPWADAACWELKVGDHQLDALAVSAGLSAAKDAASVELWRRQAESARARGRPSPPGPRRINPRVAVVEVKVSRQDLCAGAKRGQFAAYGASDALRPTHCSVAVWDGAMCEPGGRGDVAAALAAAGVPTSWGVMIVRRGSSRLLVDTLRPAARERPTPDLAHRLGLVELMARSLAYRVLSRSSPEDESYPRRVGRE